MTNVITRIATPPAWYPDPADSTLLRYWDGLGWTSQQSPNPALAAPLRPTAPASVDEPDFYYEPMVSAQHRAQRRQPEAFTVRGSTAAAWAYALVPLLALPFLLSGPSLDSSDSGSVLRAGLLGLMVLALGVLATVDHSLLRRRGVLNAPSGLVGIIPVAFVIDRTVRVGRSGAGIVIVSLAVQAAVAALAIWRVVELLA